MVVQVTRGAFDAGDTGGRKLRIIERTFMPGSSGFFLSGGTLPPGAPSYLERRADGEVLQLLRAGRSVSILDSRQKGKSSLISRVIHILRAEGFACIKLDLQRFGANLSAPQWYSSLAQAVWEQDSAMDSTSVGTAAGLVERLAAIVRAKPEKRLAVFFDEIDFVRALPFSADELFAAVRACLNARSDDAALERLSFCFIGSGLPGQLTRLPSTGAMDMSATVALDDFAMSDIRVYARALPPETLDPEKCIERIYWWSEGHPYLTQFLCEALSHCDKPSPRAVDDIVESEFLGSESQTNNAHLSQIGAGLMEMGDESVPSAALLEAYAAVLKRPRLMGQFPKPVLEKLRLSGLVRVEAGRVFVRNRIYARAFDRRWVRDNLPEADLLRQRRAARRATIRTSLVGLAVCSVLAWLALSNLQLARSRQRALDGAVASESAALREAYIGTIQSAYAEANSRNWMAAAEAVDQLKSSPHRSWEWSYLNGLLRRHDEEYQLESQVRDLVVHPDGLGITALTSQGVAWIRHGQVRRLALDVSPLKILSLSGDGRFVAASGKEAGLLVEAETGNLMATFKAQPLGFYPQSNFVLAHDRAAERLLLLDREGRVKVVSPEPHPNIFTHAISRDGRLVATVARGEMVLLDGQTLKKIRSWPVAYESSAAAFDPAGQRIFVGFIGAPVVAYRLDGSSYPCEGTSLEGQAISLSVSRDGRLLAAGHGEGTAALYEAGTGRMIDQFLGHRARLMSVDFFADGRRIAAGDESGLVRVWKVSRRSAAMISDQGPRDAAVGVINADGSTLGVSDGHGTVSLFDIAGVGGRIARVTTGTGAYTPLQYSAKLERFAAFGRGELLLIDRQGSVVRKPLKAAGRPVAAAVDAEGARAVIATAEGVLAMVDMQTAEVEILDRGVRSTWYRLAMSHGGTYAAVGSPDGSVGLWSLVDKRRVKSWDVHDDLIRTIEFSPSDDLLASAGHDEKVVLYDLASREISQTLIGHTSRIYRVRFAPDGTSLASFSFDGTARVWDVPTGTMLHTFRHRSWIADAAYNPAGDRIVTAGSDHTVKVWDVRSGREVATLSEHRDIVFWAQFTPDGGSLVSVGKDGRIYARRAVITPRGG